MSIRLWIYTTIRITWFIAGQSYLFCSPTIFLNFWTNFSLIFYTWQKVGQHWSTTLGLLPKFDKRYTFFIFWFLVNFSCIWLFVWSEFTLKFYRSRRYVQSHQNTSPFIYFLASYILHNSASKKLHNGLS